MQADALITINPKMKILSSFAHLFQKQ